MSYQRYTGREAIGTIALLDKSIKVVLRYPK